MLLLVFYPNEYIYIKFIFWKGYGIYEVRRVKREVNDVS